MRRSRSNVFTSVEEYKGAAIYALVDDNGKMYIGSTNNYQRRITMWAHYMNKVIAEQKLNGWIPTPLGEALLAGKRFCVKVIKALPSKISYEQRLEHEHKALFSAGYINSTYNSLPISHIRPDAR